MKLIGQQDGWRLYCHANFLGLFSAPVDLSDLVKSLTQLPTVLKDNHRSSVRRGLLFELDIVAKQPHDKHRRKWARFVSAFGPGESRRTIENLAKLRDAGVETITPMFALERRRFGMVVDSYACYQYREGQPVGPAGIAEIIALLNQMHASGFRHEDPTWNNFLRDTQGMLFTIDTKAKPCRSAFHITNDFLLLKRANKLTDFDFKSVPELNRRAPGYWLAIAYNAIKIGRSALRDKVRKNRLKNE